MGNKTPEQNTKPRMQGDYDYLFKMLLVGIACGKSCLNTRISDDIFSENSGPTLGGDFRIRTIEIGGKIVKNQIWEVSGRDRDRALLLSWCKGAHIIIFVFDVTYYESLEYLRKSSQEVIKNAKEGVKLLVVGNKVDLESERKVSYDTAVRFAEEIGAGYLETSAKTGYNVQEMLRTAAEYCMGTRNPSKGRQERMQQVTSTPPDSQLQYTTTTTTTQGEKEHDHVFKLLLVGPTNSGKSCILKRLTEDSFTSSFISTIGVNFGVKTLDVYGKKTKLQVYDTSGQERFKAIQAYFKGANGIVLVYDVTKKETFFQLQTFYEDVKILAFENVKLMVAGNKVDLESKREVAYDEGKAFAEGIGAGFLEISAKNGDNVQELFTGIAHNLLNSQ